MRIINTLLVILVFNTTISLAQKQYSSNRPGNDCYMQYICFTQDGKYNSTTKPYIFQLGKPGQTAQQIFDLDTLKNIAQFTNYMFVYIPNIGKSSSEKLHCIDALSSLLTRNYANGYSNLFLDIKDDSITQSDLIKMKLNLIFKSIKIADPEKPKENITTIKSQDTLTQEKTESITDNFKEELVVSKSAKLKPPTYKGPPKNFNFTLSGKIVDENSSEALPFATITLKGKPIGTTTNADGIFTLVKVPTDTTTLIINYLGYKKTEYKLSPLQTKSNLIIEIEPSSNILDEITVTVEQEELMSANENLSVIKMSPSKLSQLPNIGEKDIMRSFQLMPGVSASNESSSGLYVRGGTPDQNLVLYDGFTVYQVDHLYGFYSAFNSNAIKDVQLYKGGYESKFGGRLSSVVEITGKDGNQKNVNVGGDISLLSVNAFAEIPIGKKITFLAAGRRSYQGPIYNLIFKEFNTQKSQANSRGNLTNTVKSYFYDLNSKLTFRPTDKDIISLSVYNGTDKLDNSRIFSRPGASGSTSSFSGQIIDLTKYGNLGGSLKWSRKWNNKIYGNTLISYSNFYSNRELSNQITRVVAGADQTFKFGTIENNDLKDYSFKSDYTIDILKNNQLGVGIFATYFDIAYNYSQNDTSTILSRHNYGGLTGAYLQDKIKFADNKLIFIPGIRASYYNVTGQNYYEPRISATYNVTRRMSLKASTGRYYQFANQVTREDLLNGNKTFWVLSDGKNVPVGQALHYIAGLSYDMHDYLFSVEGWYKDLSGLTQHSLRFNTNPRQSNYSENFYQGIGYSQGLEFLIQKKHGQFTGWISYTMSKTRSKFDIYSPNYYAADQDVPNEAKIVGIYKYKRFVFSATVIYASGRPYTAPSGAYNLTLLDGTSQNYYTVSTKNSLRLPDYNRMDIAATYLFRSESGAEIGSLGVSVFNVYNRKNVWYNQYQIVDQQIIQTNIRYLGITPNLTLSLKLR
jgi:hypothetical protein